MLCVPVCVCVEVLLLQEGSGTEHMVTLPVLLSQFGRRQSSQTDF